jgi:transcriptional regulator with XRE-family HTH domain
MGFKENLKEQLSFSGMYVKELAALSGIKKQTIDSYLNAYSCMPSAEAAVAIARVLNLPNRKQGASFFENYFLMIFPSCFAAA